MDGKERPAGKLGRYPAQPKTLRGMAVTEGESFNTGKLAKSIVDLLRVQVAVSRWLISLPIKLNGLSP